MIPILVLCQFMVGNVMVYHCSLHHEVWWTSRGNAPYVRAGVTTRFLIICSGSELVAALFWGWILLGIVWFTLAL
jgi:hypothetical protein